MALEVIKRPSKDMADGFESRWNGSRTPLNYKFRSNLFPVNEVDNIGTIKRVIYYPTRLGTAVQFNETRSSLNLAVNDYVLINGTGTELDGNTYRIKGTTETNPGDNNGIIINAKYDGLSTTGTGIKYYKGYKALVSVYVGSPSYHPYLDDNSKPEYLASQMQVEFGNDNEGTGNVRQFVKPDLNSKFDEGNENSHYAWTSFFIEFTETWDNKITATQYTRDILPQCIPFNGFIDSSFSNGLNDWSQRGGGTDWVSGSNSVSYTSTGASKILYQDIDILTTGNYTINLNVSYPSGRNYRIDFINSETSSSGYIITNGSGTYSFNLSVGQDFTSLGVSINDVGSSNPQETFTLNSFSISATNGMNPCDYYSFAVFGSKQFQDPIGGNFGDYVLRPFGTNEAPKMLTNFESIELFPNNSFLLPDGSNRVFYRSFQNYFNSIIPSSTFSQSEDSDNVFIEFNTFKNNGESVGSGRQKITNKSDGVYVKKLQDGFGLVEFDYGYCQFVTIPSNMMQDGDNGTYENRTPSTWNMSPISTSAVVNYGSVIIDNLKTASIGMSIDLVDDTIYDLISFDSEISTIIGREYIIESEFYIRSNTFDPRIGGKVGAFLGVEGIDPSNTIFNTSFFPDYDTGSDYVKSVITTTFTSTQTTHKVILKLESNIDVNSSGGTFFLDNTTFKGPIDYISEKKHINVNTDCFGYKGVELRWLNTLGGWEYWKFKQYQDVKEKFKKTEIKSDIFTDYDDYFINGQSQYKAISVDSRKSVTVRSGLLTEDQLKNVSALQRSIEIQYKTELGKWQTCSIKSGSFTSLEEKNNIREISFDIELVDTLTQEL